MKKFLSIFILLTLTSSTVYAQEVTQEEALRSLNDAVDAIAMAKMEELDTKWAEAKLQEAQMAYEDENYELAKSLAEESVALSEEAPPAEEPYYSCAVHFLGLVVLMIGSIIFKENKRIR